MKCYKKYYLFILIFISGTHTVSSQILFDTVNLDAKIALNYTTSIDFDSQNNMWISTSRGLYKIDGYSSKYYVFNPNDSLSLLNNSVFNTYEDKDSILWILTDKGIQYYDQKLETFHSILQSFVDQQKDLYKITFTCAKQIDKNRLIFGTKSGCLIYNKVSKEYNHYDIIPKNEVDGYSSFAHVIEIIENPKNINEFFLLTRSGLFSFNTNTSSFTKMNIGPGNFQDIAIPGLRIRLKNDVFYMIIKTNIYSYNILTKQSKDYYIDTPFKDMGMIRDFVFLSEDKILVSTANSGLYQIDINKPDYLSRIQEGPFNKFAIDAKGYLWTILETSSIIRTKEPLFKGQPHKQKVTINRFWVNDIPLLKRDVLKEDVFKLKDFQRNMLLEVSLPNPIDKANVTYSYNLRENRNDWISIPKDRILVLENLSPGDYKLIIKAQIGKAEHFSEPFMFNVDKYFYETWWFRALILSTISFFLLSTYYLINSRKRERIKHQRNILSMELDALRSQMNPHFLFNTLNSIKNYVLTKTPDEAAHYLTRFAQLIRSILENSKSEFLTLEQELDAMKLYVEMEHLRFGKDFNYEFNIDETINVVTFKIAPMLLQPYVENAIWHGLMNKRSDRSLEIKLTKATNGVKCEIIDNGIGRTASQELYKNRPNKKSLGLKITQDRINNINLLYDFESSVLIEDNKPMGTKVTIYLPEIKG